VPATPFACFLLAALLVAACGNSASPEPTASPTPSPASPTAEPSAEPTEVASQTPVAETVYEDLEASVIDIRGLDARRPVERTLLSKAELGEKLEADFLADNPQDYLLALERLYRGLGLIEPDASLTDLYIELLTSQVAGFYRPDDEAMFVLADAGFGPVERVFYAHEFTHALQDQHFDPWADADGLLDETDRAIGRTALTEGDATLLMTQWLASNLSPAEAFEIVRAGLDPAAAEVLARMPPILAEPLLFPYEDGLELVLGMYGDGGWAAVDEAYDDPPASTEQVLHPEAWRDREPPIAVAVPADLAAEMGPGWSVGLEDTIGELQLRIWLRTGRDDADDATEAAAAGWGGDRVVLLDGPDGASAIAILSEWDSPEDAAEFAEQATLTRDAIGLVGTVAHRPGTTTVRVLLGSDQDVAVRLDEILGRTGV
jgi:hypothetical protein